MSYFKSSLAVVLFTALSIHSDAQVDAAEVDDDKDTTTQIVQVNKIMPHKRGVYKTYEEYINNSPSIDAEFTLTPLQITKHNPLIAEADVDYKGKRPRNIWGISDGQYVYIRVMVGNFYKNHYFRLQCDGPVPYFYYIDKSVTIASGLGLVAMAAIAAGTAALPPSVSLEMVKEKTNYLFPFIGVTDNRLKNYLKEYPDLLDAYSNEPKHNKAIKIKYLTDYNNRKLKS